MLLFLKVTLTVFVAEMGDKTQLMLIALASKYRLRDIVLGTAAAIMVLNAIAVIAGGLIGAMIPAWILKAAAALAFIFFALSSLRTDDDGDEEEGGSSRISFAPAAVFVTFFLAELGDKTQLSAITFGANEGLSNGLIVWGACSIGLFAADIIGLMVGYLLKSRIPDKGLSYLSFVLFGAFGFVTLRQALILNCGAESAVIGPVLFGLILVYAAALALKVIKRTKPSK